MTKISPKHIAEALSEAIQGKSGIELAEVLKRGAKYIQSKNMLGKSEEILNILEDIVEKKSGVVRVKFTTAKSIGNEERKKMEDKIREKYKIQIIKSEFFERRELLGGSRVEIGDEVIDTTYKSRLQKLEKFLIQSK